MSKAKPTKPRDSAAKPSTPAEARNSHATRETIESIVIAFVLAFLFRTFEAEAFVIPTGSMAPTLMGLHKDVHCQKCGHRYRVTASEEGEEAEQRRAEIRAIQADIREANRSPQKFRDFQAQQHEIFRLQQVIGQKQAEIEGLEIVGGVCPICRFPMPMVSQLPEGIREQFDAANNQKSYNGDRILVNKYLYAFTEPERFSVIVFHYPGDAETNYIKRLVGLPGETLRVFQGDLHVGPLGAANDEDFQIVRKPPDKVLAVRQLVHDTNYDPAELFDAGWPLRWEATTPTGADGWQLATETDVPIVRQRYTVDRSRGGESWMRYFHRVPDDEVWRMVGEWKRAAQPEAKAPFTRAQLRPQLIMDFNAYNTRVQRGEAQGESANGNLVRPPRLWPDEFKLGVHWVGDLMLEADVDVEETSGALLLDLVEAGKHFKCRIELATGRATLGIDGLADFAPTAETSLRGAGDYRVAFANVDDQLLLWIDGDLVEFDRETAYDALAVFGQRRIRPRTTDPGQPDKLDLSPAGVGVDGAKLAVSRLSIWRDIYYIADSSQRRRAEGGGGPISDYLRPSPEMIAELRHNPDLWDAFLTRRDVDFPLQADQFFVMGDNSPESSDARLWLDAPSRGGGNPGGAYLERKLLIGKAVCVYWPHAAYSISFVPIWPNFKDIRLVR